MSTRKSKLAWVVEDDTEMRRLVATVLRRAGFAVEEFADGAQVVAGLKRLLSKGRRRPAVLIMDNHMPEMHGLDAVAAMRELAVEIPVIVITAFGDPQTHARAQQLGVAAVFDKPFDLDTFSTFAVGLVARR